MLNVQIVLFDGFDLLDAIAPYEVFCAAGMTAGGGVHVEFVSADGPRHVISGVNGVKLEARGKLSPDQQGIILVPGASGELAGDGPDSIPVLLARASNTELTGMLVRALENPKIVVATVCGGSLVLAMGGMLEGRPAVTHHLGMDVLGETGAIPVNARVVDDGNLVMGGGVTSGLDVALYLVERELGPRITHEVEQLFEYERRGTVWRSTGISPGDGAKIGDPNASKDSSSFLEVRATANASTSSSASPSLFEGEWDATIETPVGGLIVKLHIATVHGVIQGTCMHGDEASPFIDPEFTGNLLRWSLRVTKPMRLTLKLEVMVDGDQMTGIAKAGVLPSSRLSGHRI